MIKGLFGKGDSESEVAVSGSNKVVLIVDDSPTEVHIFKKVLETQGFKVISAENGQEGLQMAKEMQPDLILMDVVMPILNGFQATRKLRQDEATSHIPVIMVTTKGQQTDVDWGKRQGANEYLVKPVKPADLLGKIKDLLNG